MNARLALWLPLGTYGGLSALGVYLPDHPGKIWYFAAMMVSLALLSVARFNLGDAFSADPRASRLVTGGLYRKFRHPIYLFSGTLMTATVLYLDWWILLLPLGVIFAQQDRRADAENQILAQTFGADWIKWRKRTWF